MSPVKLIPIALQIVREATALSAAVRSRHSVSQWGGNFIALFIASTIVAAITAKKTKKALPTHVSICKEAAGVGSDSVILCEQMRTIDKCRLREKTGHLSDEIMSQVDIAIKKSLSC